MKKLSILLVLALIASGMVFGTPVVTWTGRAEYEGAWGLTADDAKEHVYNDAISATGAGTPVERTAFDESYLLVEPDFRVEMRVRIDDMNSAFIRSRLNPLTPSGTSAIPDAGGTATGWVWFDRAHLTTDWTTLFGLSPDLVRITSMYGWNSWDLANVAAVANFDQGNFDKDLTYWGGRKMVSLMRMVDLSFTYDLSGVRGAKGVVLYDFLLNAVARVPAGPGTLRAEVAYGREDGGPRLAVNIGHDNRPLFDVNRDGDFADTEDINIGRLGGTNDNKGFMVFGASYSMPVTPEFTVAAGGAYNLELTADYNSQWDFGLRAAYAVKDGVSAYATVGLQGFMDGDILETRAKALKAVVNPLHRYDAEDGKGEMLSTVKISTGVAHSVFGADLGVVLYTGGNKSNLFFKQIDPDIKTLADVEAYDLFNALDISAFLRVGVATFRLGYLFVPEYQFSIDALHTDARQNSLYLVVNAPF